MRATGNNIPGISLGLIAVATLLGGCQHGEKTWGSGTWHATGYDGASLVFASPELAQLDAQRDPAVLPWFAARRDQLPSVEAGYVTPTYLFSRTYTHDRESISSGRPRTTYHQHTWSVESSLLIR